MKKTKAKSPKKIVIDNEPAANNQYEDYLVVKKKEQQETEMLESIEQLEEEMFEATLWTESPVHEQMGRRVNPNNTPQDIGWSAEGSEQQGESIENISGVFKNKKANKQLHPMIAKFTGGPRSSAACPPPCTAGAYTKYGTAIMEPVLYTEVQDVESLPEMADSEAKLPSDIEQFHEVRSSLRLIRSSDSTLVYCIVVDKKNETNVVAGLQCYGGVAFGGYARDVSGDAYLVECVQAVHLGSIPFSFSLEMSKVGNWSVDIPIPEKVLESAFVATQRKTLSDLRERFPEDRYELQYLQMLQSN